MVKMIIYEHKLYYKYLTSTSATFELDVSVVLSATKEGSYSTGEAGRHDGVHYQPVILPHMQQLDNTITIVYCYYNNYLIG